MNIVTLIGRLTRDPEIRYNGNDDNSAMATFNVAIDRPPRKDGTKGADFPRIIVFGKQAVNCERYLAKGKLVGIQGRIQTGSYEKNGERVYTTDVIGDRVEFLEYANSSQNENASVSQGYQGAPQYQNNPTQSFAPQQSFTPQQNAPMQSQGSAWEAIDDDDIPF